MQVFLLSINRIITWLSHWEEEEVPRIYGSVIGYIKLAPAEEQPLLQTINTVGPRSWNLGHPWSTKISIENWNKMRKETSKFRIWSDGNHSYRTTERSWVRCHRPQNISWEPADLKLFAYYLLKVTLDNKHRIFQTGVS